jgi:Protein of unknown function (DUF1552)
MSKSRVISRRMVLRGIGASLALPWLEAMTPALAGTGAGKGAASPLRMAFFYVPNGVHMPLWQPKTEGKGYELPAILKPLEKRKDDLLVLTGLTQDKAFGNGDGAGDHARSLATFLTGAQAFKTDGANIHVGESVDQVAARQIGKQTRFGSIELGIDRGGQSGNCDSGYSCAYSSNISWRSPTTPTAKEVNPRLVFERLFAADGGANRARRDKYRLSILDFVNEDARRLNSRLGVTDRRKLDEYLSSVRELETRIARVEAGKEPEVKTPDYPRPTGVPKDYAEHVRLMFDLLALAFQGDVTRISTFVYANEGSTKSYSFIGVPEGHHDLSHHAGDTKKHEKITTINTFHISLFAGFLDKLATIKEGDGSLLDHSMIVYGSGISDGNRHNHDDLPILMAGKANGTIKPGRHVVYPRRTPLNNLYLSMLDRLDVKIPGLGDSKGRLNSLEG